MSWRFLLVILGLLSGACGGVLAGARWADPIPFRHGRHVNQLWLSEPETPRDCAVCHDYTTAGQVGDPQRLCLRCHYPEGSDPSLVISATRPELETSLESLRPKDGIFDHHVHGGFSCQRCHLPEGDLVPDRMPVPDARGAALCEQCHDPGRRDLPGTGNPSPTGFVSALDGSPRMQEVSGVFRHREHLSLAALLEPESCESCHRAVSECETAALGDQVFTSSSCAACHTSSGQESPIRVEPVRTPSAAAATFRHDEHRTVEGGGCLACHRFDVDRGVFGYVPGFWGQADYASCGHCHYHQEANWRVEDHGEVTNCLPCHVLGHAGSHDMRTERPVVEVRRPRFTRVVSELHAHPGVTGERAEACKECHVSQRDTLRSRARSQRFRHSSHLPETPTARDCAKCHGTEITGARSSAELTRLYRADACAECHRTAGTLEIVEDELDWMTEVGNFPHELHLEAQGESGGPRLGCLDCHEGAADETDIGTRPEAKDCTGCHDHDTRVRDTGGRDRAYVDTCVRCHRDGIPAAGEVIELARSGVRGTALAQLHPPDRRCSECHRGESDVRVAVMAAEPHVFGTRTGDIHSRSRPDECLCCHWGTNVDDPQEFFSDQRLTSPRRLRELMGSQTEGYPGKACQ